MQVAVVGCGRVAETCHLPALRGLGERVRVVAIADVDEHRRRRVAASFDVPRSFAGVEAMLHDAPVPIDVVAVCTPAPFHADAVAAALRAGRHVLVEKPLALTLDDADRIEAAAAAVPYAKVMLGFNLRHHRLVERARRMIGAGALGELQVVRTVWTSGIRGRGALPAWRERREAGGGVLCEIAVHHVDLVRHLTGADVRDVFAEARHGEGDDESAALTMRLEGGAIASCAFSERGGDANEIELSGTRGRLTFSIYRFDSLTFMPTGTYGGRGRHLVQTLRDLPEVWPILRRGGDFRETYRRQWLSFLDAIARDVPVAATVADGREALRVVLAAGASANTRSPVPVADAPRAPVPVDRVRETPRAIEHDLSRPRLSAIIATRGSFDAIRRTVGHLRAQTVREHIELVIVCPRADDLKLDEREVCGFHGLRIVEIGAIESAARANAAGVRAAAAPVVVLCEDHAFPDPDWAKALLLAHRGPYAVVGPAVRNANPDTAVSRADCLIGYGPWLEPIRPCEPAHLPGHNSSYKRDALLAYGDRLDEMMEAETVLQWDLRARGHRLYLDPRARLAHTNFARLGVWTRVQFHAGRMFAATRATGWPWWKRLAFAGGSPLIPLVRFARTVGPARRVGNVGSFVSVLPALLWGLAMDGLGQMAGYATGAGSSWRRMTGYEFERVRFITEEDRRAFVSEEPVAATNVSHTGA